MPKPLVDVAYRLLNRDYRSYIEVPQPQDLTAPELRPFKDDILKQQVCRTQSVIFTLLIYRSGNLPKHPMLLANISSRTSSGALYTWDMEAVRILSHVLRRVVRRTSSRFLMIP